jgi:signal transduction histidine kinase
MKAKAMPPRRSFERRLLLALALFSLIPSLLLLGAGVYLLSQAVALHTSAATFERLAESGRRVLELAEATGDPRLAEAAAAHRQALSSSYRQALRWEYLNDRVLGLIPVVGVLFAALLVGLAIRSARGIARELSRPIRELVGWARRVARQEPLPPAAADQGGSGEFGVLRDAFRSMASEIEAARARAVEAERTRTWVTMARSVAHELKNSLTPLRLAVRALERQADHDPRAREPVEVLRSEAARLEELALAFSQFGRLPEGPASEIDLAEQLDYLLRTHLPSHVAGRVRAPVGLPPVLGHHDALARAFSNLLLNAVEAMGDAGGNLTVTLASVGEAVEVRVLDTGPGIPQEHLDRIWDPEFTTKPRGTGLGLALVRQTVQAHGGAIRARNRPEGGTEFRVVLPTGCPSPVTSDQSGLITGNR